MRSSASDETGTDTDTAHEERCGDKHFINDLNMIETDSINEKIKLIFSLPSGSFATSLLREITHNDSLI